MEPELTEGDEVLVSPIPYILFRPKEKDIIAFRLSNKILIKRIKRINRSHFLPQGDNISDSLRLGWIEKKDIIGKLIFKL